MYQIFKPILCNSLSKISSPSPSNIILLTNFHFSTLFSKVTPKHMLNLKATFICLPFKLDKKTLSCCTSLLWVHPALLFESCCPSISWISNLFLTILNSTPWYSINLSSIEHFRKTIRGSKRIFTSYEMRTPTRWQCELEHDKKNLHIWMHCCNVNLEQFCKPLT